MMRLLVGNAHRRQIECGGKPLQLILWDIEIGPDDREEYRYRGRGCDLGQVNGQHFEQVSN
jgi:hypothetical protein